MVEGIAEIQWKKDATKKVFDEIKENHAYAESSGISWVQENHLLVTGLGPLQPGHVRGVSSYIGRKHAWPQFADLYRKRKRIRLVDLQRIMDELRVEVA